MLWHVTFYSPTLAETKQHLIKCHPNYNNKGTNFNYCALIHMLILHKTKSIFSLATLYRLQKVWFNTPKPIRYPYPYLFENVICVVSLMRVDSMKQRELINAKIEVNLKKHLHLHQKKPFTNKSCKDKQPRSLVWKQGWFVREAYPLIAKGESRSFELVMKVENGGGFWSPKKTPEANYMCPTASWQGSELWL